MPKSTTCDGCGETDPDSSISNWLELKFYNPSGISMSALGEGEGSWFFHGQVCLESFLEKRSSLHSKLGRRSPGNVQ